LTSSCKPHKNINVGTNNNTRPPGRNTRRISRKPARSLSRCSTTSSAVTRSNVPSSYGSSSAAPSFTFSRPRSRQNASASSETSTPSASPYFESINKFAPVPQPTSKILGRRSVTWRQISSTKPERMRRRPMCHQCDCSTRKRMGYVCSIISRGSGLPILLTSELNLATDYTDQLADTNARKHDQYTVHRQHITYLGVRRGAWHKVIEHCDQ